MITSGCSCDEQLEYAGSEWRYVVYRKQVGIGEEEEGEEEVNYYSHVACQAEGEVQYTST